MPAHLVVDGSNIATEGRTHPSIYQLHEAVMALAAEHPAAKIIVVVDATFGHRIDPAEVEEFDAAVANNELVAPPAGAIGRGDAFVLGIADKVNGSILSNDSYQEFHGQYTWLFDEGRLIGGKPVPHVGWVFVNRLPVRGPLSRKSVSEAKRKGGRSKGPTAPDAGDGSVRVGSAEANKPMPVPKTPPPGAVVSRAAKKATDATAKAGNDSAPRKRGVKQAQPERLAPAGAERGTPHELLNDQLGFLSFVAEHPVGASVEAVVDHYSSHGAYVRMGDVRGYVPLRLMGTPAPTSARSAMKIGETVHLVVHQYVAGKRSIDLAVASGAPVGVPSGRKSTTSTAGLRKAAAAVEPSTAGKNPTAKKPTTGRTAAKPSAAVAVRQRTTRVAPKAAAAKVTAAASKTPASKAAAPKAVTSKAAASKTAVPKAVTVKAAASKAVTSKAVTSKAVTSKATAAKPAASKSVRAKATPNGARAARAAVPAPAAARTTTAGTTKSAAAKSPATRASAPRAQRPVQSTAKSPRRTKG